MADEFPEHNHRSPQSLGGSAVSFVLYVEDADAAFERAIEAGATVYQAMEDKFYGDRAGCVADPFGYRWTLMTHQEDVSPEEMERRLAAEYAKTADPQTAGA